MTIDKIILEVKEYNSSINEKKLRLAYTLAEEAHRGQYRYSGEPYITHPLAVTEILVEFRMDELALIAALLHDVVEDAGVELSYIEKYFGREVAYIVDGLTKLKKIKISNKDTLQVENLRRMFLTMSRDIRVVLIKLSDRLHNMRTLKYMSREKQVYISEETLEIYSPIANRLGVSQIKWELEDLALKYIDPEGYHKLIEQIAMKRNEREDYVQDVILKIRNSLKQLCIEGDVNGRPKHFYSIYNKMKKKNHSLDEIYDLTAVRIIVKTLKDCYSAVGAIHTLYRPIPNRFKDYIAMPKPNSYQSIHTTLLGSDGEPFEVQIRTKEMHHIAEYGIAAHWKYKEGKSLYCQEFQKESSFVSQIREIQSEADNASDFIDSLKKDLFTDRLYVFTPGGDVIELKSGSNPLDFAYRVHSDIGNQFFRARVNNHIVSIDYKLQNGDIVEILTNKNSKPSFDWLKIAQTKNAQHKIRNWFKMQNREIKEDEGRDIFNKEVKREQFDKKYLTPNYLMRLAKSYGMQDISDLYSAISDGGYSIKQVIQRLREYVKEEIKDIVPKYQIIKPWEGYSSSTQGIRVQGFEDVDIRISKCCNPMPSDDISGYINRCKGISIHRVDCPNFIYLNNKEPYRIVDVIWETKEVKNLVANLEITAIDRKRITPDVISLFHELKANVIEINSKVSGGVVIMKIKVGINNSEHLERLFAIFNRNPEILNAKRLIPRKRVVKKTKTAIK